MKISITVIQKEKLWYYKKTLLAVRNKLNNVRGTTNDGSLKAFLDKHIPVLDELLEELGYRGKL